MLLVFAAFAIYLKDPLTWSQGAGFALIAIGASFCFTSGEGYFFFGAAAGHSVVARICRPARRACRPARR